MKEPSMTPWTADPNLRWFRDDLQTRLRKMLGNNSPQVFEIDLVSI